MVKSMNLQKKKVKLILASIISLLLFQSILSFIKADDLIDGPLEISTPHNSFSIGLGSNMTITWSFNVPSHEYAVYWEIIGQGVSKNGWGLNANCTTPVVTANGTVWNYKCSGYYAKYYVWSTVSVIGPEEEPEEEPEPEPEPENGNGNGYSYYIPGFPPSLLIIVISTCVIFKIITFHLKSKKEKFQ